MKNKGWIRINRDILDWEWWGDKNVVIFWIYCIVKANHQGKSWKGLKIEPGQFVYGRTKACEETGLSAQECRTAINKLKSTSNLTSKSTNKFSLITVQKWQDFQLINQQINQQPNKRATNKQPQLNNVNNVNNITTGEVKKKLLKWLSGMEDVTSPQLLAAKYARIYSESTIKRALNDPACVSRIKFTQLCDFYKNKKKS